MNHSEKSAKTMCTFVKIVVVIVLFSSANLINIYFWLKCHEIESIEILKLVNTAKMSDSIA